MPPVLIAHGASAGTIDAATLSGLDTTAAKQITVSVSWYVAGTAPTLTDSKGNTWIGRTQRNASAIARERLYDCANPTVGTGHSFTATGTGSAPVVCVVAFSGVDTFDGQNGAGTPSGQSTLQTGSLTPSADAAVVVTGICWDTSGQTATIGGGFTVAAQVDGVGGVNMGGAIAYLIQTTAAAANPTWTLTTGGNLAAGIAAYKLTGGAPPTVSASIMGPSALVGNSVIIGASALIG